MARLFDDASSQYLQRSAALVTAYPQTFACWYNTDDGASSQTLWESDSNDGSASTKYTWLCLNGGSVKCVIQNGAGTQKVATSAIGYSTDTWEHACGVWASSTLRTAYINGGNSGTNTDSLAFPTIGSRAVIGGFRPNTNQYMSGLIAEAALWNVALTAAEVASLAQGVCPLFVRPESIVAYWPLMGRYSPEIDLLGANTLSLFNSPTTGAHPRVYYPSSPLTLGVPAAGTTYTESGSGGVVLGGVGTVVGDYAPTAAGGIVLGGVSDLVGSYTPTVAGGLVVGGSGTEAGAYVFSPAGGVVLGGVGTEAGSYVPGTSGGVVLGGVGTDSLGSQYTESGSGGVVLGGVGTVAGSYVPTAAGGLVVGGVATVTADYSPSASGGIVLGGVAEPTASYTITPAGGVVLGGACTVTFTSAVMSPFVLDIADRGGEFYLADRGAEFAIADRGYEFFVAERDN